MVAAGGLAAIQFAAALRFFLRQRRRLPALPEPPPPLAIVVAYKGGSAGLAEHAAALLAQDYPGPVEWLLTVGEAGDPARATLESAAAGRKGAKVVVAGEAPSRSSAKAVNLLAGVAAASPDARVFLFADADLRVGRDWASLMVAGLQQEGAVLSTSVMLSLGGGFASRLRLSWMAFGLPWFEPMGLAAGQSLAVRRSDFEALGAAELWRGSVSEDLALCARARERGGRVSLVMAAAPVSLEDGGAREALSQFNRWMTLFRFYRPDVWALGFAVTAVKLGALVQACQRPWCGPLAAVVLGGDFAFLLAALVAAGGRGVGAAALAPLLLPVLALNYLASSFYREIVWSGWSYRLDGTKAEPGDAPARAARRARLLRLLACALGGAAFGLAYLPGRWGVLAWAAFVPLLWALAQAPPAAAAAWGTVFGTVAYLFGSYWMYGFIRGFIGAGPPEAAVWLVAISALHGARWGACAAVAALAPAGARRVALFSLGAVLLEPFVPTLFPAPFAVTQLFYLPTVQCLEVLGTAGPAFLILAVNAALFLALRERRARDFAFAAFCGAALLGNEAWGRRRLARIEAEAASRPVLRAGLVQGGRRPAARPQPDRFAQDIPLYAALTRRALAAGAAELVVWPESTYAGVLDYDLGAPARTLSDDRPLAAALRSELRLSSPLLLSAIGRGADGLERNVAALTDGGGVALGLTEKTFLAPFGEYMPGGAALSWLYRVSPLTGHLSRGTGSRVLELGPARLGVMICYESFIPAPAERLVGLGANLLVAQTNDSWFDGSAELEEHLRLSVLRAIENRRALIHAANTGVSAMVSPAGRIVARVEAGREGALAWNAPLMDVPTGGPRVSRRLFALAAAFWVAGAAWSLRGARA